MASAIIRNCCSKSLPWMSDSSSPSASSVRTCVSKPSSAERTKRANACCPLARLPSCAPDCSAANRHLDNVSVATPVRMLIFWIASAASIARLPNATAPTATPAKAATPPTLNLLNEPPALCRKVVARFSAPESPRLNWVGSAKRSTVIGLAIASYLLLLRTRNISLRKAEYSSRGISSTSSIRWPHHLATCATSTICLFLRHLIARLLGHSLLPPCPSRALRTTLATSPRRCRLANLRPHLRSNREHPK